MENINTSFPNDGLGDKFRNAFIKVNNNFTELNTNKVNKITGKGLSTEDYTTPEKTKLAGLSNFDPTSINNAVANKVDKVTGKSLLSDTEITRLATLSNYTHPANHPPSIITQDASNRFVTDVEKTAWNAKQGALGFTPESVVNKVTDISTGANNTTYPSSLAVKTYADNLVVGMLNDRGTWDASGNVFPTTGGSGVGGVIRKGDMWYISVAGILGTKSVNVGDSFERL